MYRPTFPPQDPNALSAWLNQETQNIARAMVDASEFTLLQVNSKPPKTPSDTRIAMFAVADGVNWNPGGGAGLYRFQNNTWTFVG